MKSFWKIVLATALGSILVSVLGFLILLAVISGIASMGEKVPTVKEGSILVLDLNKKIVDRSTENPFKNIDFMAGEIETPLGLNDILKNIDKAAHDERIKGILLETGALQCGIATAQEIRGALERFKSSGKFIISYADAYSQGAYYLASVADKVFVNPEGTIDLKGLVLGTLYMKKTLDKLGVKAEVVKCGKYKSATEPFVNERMSPENREQLSVFVNGVWKTISEQIAQSRGLQGASVDRAAVQLTGFDMNQMLKEGFVDGLRYKSQAKAYIDSLLSYNGEENSPTIKLEEYTNVPAKNAKYHKEKIAVIYAQGNIVDEGKDDEIVGKTYAEEIEKAAKDKDVKAIVLRVNSGGGSALASEDIRYELAKARTKKPVVVSMGDYAASGGYWISTPADVIVAEPTTLTGSIGVFGMFMNVEQGLRDKLGINPEIVRTHPSSDLGTPLRPMSNAEKMTMQKMVDKVYDRFVSLVSDARKLPKESVLELGQGRIWTGVDGKRLGLVDELGGLNVAVRIAAQKANLKGYRIEELPEAKDIFTQMMESFGQARVNSLTQEFGPLFTEYAKVMSLIRTKGGILARIPYEITIE